MVNGNAGAQSAVINDEEENVEKNPYSFHNVFKQVVACVRKHEVSPTEIFAILPHNQFSWYCQAQFCRSYKAASEGEVLEGIMSPKLADSIVEATKALSGRVVKAEKKLRVKEAVPPAEENLSEASATEMNDVFFNLVAVKVEEPVEEQVDPPIKPNLLGYDDFKNMVTALEKDKQIPLKSILPNLTKQFWLDVRQFLSLENRAAKRAKFAISFEVASHIAGIYDGFPSVSDPVSNKGRDYLPDDIVDIREMTLSLTGMFNAAGIDVKYDLKDVYDYVPAEYKKVVGLYEIKGWFERGVTLARKDIACMFMSAAIAKVNDLTGDKILPTNQTDLLNYQPELHPVQ